MPAAPAVAFFPILANVGTPLMWATALHLLVGNFIVGCLEGYLIARIWRSSAVRAVGFMILANYVSALIGVLAGDDVERVLTVAAENAGHWGFRPRIDNLIEYHVRGVACMWLVTVLLEWSFCRIVAWGCPRPWRTSLCMSMLAQTVSYPLLVCLVAPLCSIAPGRAVVVAPAVQVARAAPFGWVYFLGEDCGSLNRVRLDGTREELLTDLNPPTTEGPLHIRCNERSSRCDLCEGYPPVRMVLANMVPHAAVVSGYKPIGEYRPRPNEPEYGAPIADLRPERARDVAVTGAFFPNEGLTVRFREESHVLRVAVETPLVRWPARWPSVLPGDFVVFEFGPQIALLDVRQGRIGFLAFGRAPLVVLDVEESVR